MSANIPPCPFTPEELRAWANNTEGWSAFELDMPTVNSHSHTEILALWLAASMEREAALRAAFVFARDSILFERGQLEGCDSGSDFINAVLGILDDEFAGLIPEMKEEPKP